MTWLTWRQHRGEALVVAVLFVIGGLILVWTGLNIAAEFQGSVAPACAQAGQACFDAQGQFGQYVDQVLPYVAWLYVLPLLLGMFVGAPLVAREVEQGTHRLVWTQSVTRMRWFAATLGLLVLATLVVFGALAVVTTSWSTPVQAAMGPWTTFDWTGLALPAHAVAALLLGVMAGALLRRVVPAMALTLAAFVALQLVVALILRPHFLPPLSITWPIEGQEPAILLESLGAGQEVIDNEEHVLQAADLARLCGQHASILVQPQGPGAELAVPRGSLTDCLQEHGIQHLSFYQPPARYWLFQAIEAAIFLSIAALCAVVSAWSISSRMT